MWSTSSKHSTVAGAIEAFVAAGTLILSSTFVVALTFPQPGYAQTAHITGDTGRWKIAVAKSHFGPERNTMVIERADASSGADTNEASNTFVVIANGKVYLATSSEASNANGVKKIDYARWKDMKLELVGENAQSIDHCGFRCQSGLPENRLTVTFKSVNGGMPEMGNTVVFNGR